MNRLIAGAAALALLAGCGGEARHEPAAKAHPKSTPSASRVEPPPTMPAAAKANSPAGAVAFGRYFIEVRNHAMRTGETAELRRITGLECFLCLVEPALVESVYRGGGHIEGGQWEPRTPVRMIANYPGGRVPKGTGFLELTIHIEPMTVTDTREHVTGTYTGSDHDRWLSISTSWREGHWCVDQLHGVSGQML